MLLNKNRIPKISSIKKTDIDESYVSRNETDGVFDDINTSLKDQSDLIDDFIGLDHTRAPRFTMSKITAETYLKVSSVDPTNIIVDSSLSDESVISHSFNNDVLGYITQPDSIISDSTIVGISENSCSKISINDVNVINSDNTSFNPYYNETLTDIIKSFKRGNVIFSIHRGGYINTKDISTGRSNNYNIFSSNKIYEENESKKFNIFNKFNLGEVVTRVSYDGISKLYIVTSFNFIIFDMDTLSSIVDSTLFGKVILDVISNENGVFFIEFINNNTIIYKYNPSTKDLYSYTISNINTHPTFSPNTISFLSDGSVIVYDKNNRFSLEFDGYRISYISITDLNDYNVTIINHTISDLISVLNIEYIVGIPTNLLIGITTDTDSMFDKTIINIVNNIPKIYDTNRYHVLELKPYSNVEYTSNNYIITTNGKYLSFVKIDNGIVSSSNLYNLGLNRNVGKIIVDFSIEGSNIVVTFNDNTHIIYTIENFSKFLNNSINVVESKNRLEFKINSKMIKIMNGIVEYIENDDIDTYTSISYTKFMTDLEFYSVFAVGSFIGPDDSINVTILTKTVGFDGITPAIRATMLRVYHGSNKHVEIIGNEGWTTTVTCDSSSVRVSNDRIYFPIKGTDGGFLIVCDYTTMQIVYNNTTSINYTKMTAISDDCSKLTIGIDDKVYNIPVIPLFHTKIGPVRTHTTSTLIFNSTDEIATSAVHCDKVYFSNNFFETKLYNLNNIVKYGNYSKFIKLGDYFISINNKFIKVYNISNLELVNVKFIDFDYNFEEIISIYNRSINEIVINFNNISISINNLDIENFENFVNINNKSTDKISSGGIHVIKDDNCISVIDAENNVSYVDILNCLTTYLFNDKPIQFKINTVNYFENKIYITLTYKDLISNHTSHGMITINTIDGNMSITQFGDSNYQLRNIDTKLISTIILNNTLYVLYYDKGIIKGFSINSGMTIQIHNFYKYQNSSLPISMNFIYDNGRYKLQVIYCPNNGTLADSKIDLLANLDHLMSINFPSAPTIFTDHFKVLNVDSNIYIIRIRVVTNVIEVIRYGVTTRIYTAADVVSWYISNYNTINVFVENPSNPIVYLVNTNGGFSNIVSIEMSNDNLTQYITDCFRLYAAHSSHLTFGEKFFDDFSNGSFVAFDNKSGNCDINKIFETIGSFVSESTQHLSYDINSLDCICDRSSYKSVRSVSFTDNIYRINVSDDTGIFSKTLTYTVNTLLNKVIQIESGTAVAAFGPLSFVKNQSLNISIDGEQSTLPVDYVRVNNDIYTLCFRKMTSSFGYRTLYQVFRNGDIFVINSLSNIETKPIVFGDGITHLISMSSSGNIYYVSLENKNLSTKIDIPGFVDIVDAVGITIDGENCILISNKSSEIGVFNTVTKVFVNIPNISSSIYGMGNLNYVFEQVSNISNDLTCTIIVRDITNNKKFAIVGCKITISIDQYDDYDFMINVNSFGRLKSFNVSDINRFSVPTFNVDYGLVFHNIINDGLVLNNVVAFELNVCKMNINSNLINSEIKSVFTDIVPVNTNVPPRIFVGETYCLLQYHNSIKIFEINFDGSVGSNPIYTINQNIQQTYKVIKSVSFSGDKVLMTFSDNISRIIQIPSDADSNFNHFVDEGFTIYTEYNPNRVDSITFFTIDNGIIGYYDIESVYIYHDGSFVKINTPKLKHFCVDNLYNRIYTIDLENRFGYINILTRSYDSIKSFHTDIVNGLNKTIYNTIEIFTNTKVYSYFDGKFFDNMVISGMDRNLSLTVFPYVDVVVV